MAWVDCDLEAVHDAGDHLIVLGRVTDLDVERPTLPLLFFQGGYGRFSPHSLAIRDARFRTQLHLVDRARPLMEKLSERTGAQVAAAYCDGSELTVLASVGAPADPRVSPAVIGQHLPVVAPLGIWWMAFADAAHVERWLGGIESADLRAGYRLALAQIRERGYCLGLATVRTEVEAILSNRPVPGEPTHQERQVIAGLALDPQDYVPPGGDETVAPERPRPDVVSLWAPTFTPQGDTALGLMLSSDPHDGQPQNTHAGDLLTLAHDVTVLAAS